MDFYLNLSVIWSLYTTLAFQPETPYRYNQIEPAYDVRMNLVI